MSIFTKSDGSTAAFNTTYKAPELQQAEPIPDNTRLKARVISATWSQPGKFNDAPQPVIEFFITDRGEYEGRLLRKTVGISAINDKGEALDKKRDKDRDFFAAILAIGGKKLIVAAEKKGKPVIGENTLLGQELVGLNLFIDVRLMETEENGRKRSINYIDGVQALPKAKVVEQVVEENEEAEEDDEYQDDIPF